MTTGNEETTTSRESSEEEKESIVSIFQEEQLESKYRVTNILGQGGFGVVYAGTRKGNKSLQVALKYVWLEKITR